MGLRRERLTIQLLLKQLQRIFRGDKSGFAVIDPRLFTARQQRGARGSYQNIKAVMRMVGKAGMQQHRPGQGA